MGQKGAWERSGQLSRIFLDYNRLYLHGEAAADDIAVLRWRRTLLDFLEGLLSSCRGREDDDSPWVHFHFEPVRSVINHSCCDWASLAAFTSGLMAEVIRALIKVQSKLPVSTPAILHVLLHRLAALSSSKEIDGRYRLVVSGLMNTLDACPAMPSETLAASLDDCLRRPSAAATWSMRAAPVLVRGVLSLVTRSPRSLCRAVVPVLVRFVTETECGMALPSSSADSMTTESPKKLSPRRTRCSSCVAVGWHRATDVPDDPREPRPLRCATQETRDIVLQAVLRWVVEAHFRECSALLQTSLHRAVCDGTRQALDACAMAAGRVSPLHFPLACKLLLALVGRVAGDDGGKVSLFFRELCAAELRCVLPRPEVCAPLRNSKGTRRHAFENDEQDFLVLPVLEGYVGHLCLCWHVSDEALTRHLVWLSQQALMVFRRLTDPEPLDAKDGGTQRSRGTAALLRSLCRALALLLTRPPRRCTSTTYVPASAGSLLEIIFDSDACPLASLPRPLARAAVDTLRREGFLRLTRMEALLGSPILRSSRISRTEETKLTSAMEYSPSKDDVTEGFDFRAADSAFRRSWSMVASGVDQYIPYSLEMNVEEDGESAGTCPPDEGYDSNGEVYEWDNFDSSPCVGDRWTRVPDEVTLRVFSFMTPKRLSRLSCVNRAWRELLGVVSIWRPFFEARWPLKSLKIEADLTGVSKMLLEAADHTRGGERKYKRRRRYVVHWDVSAEGDGDVEPTRDWMALYRGRHRAELATRGRCASKTSFPWMVCPFLGCVSYLKSEFAVKRHIQTHKPQRKARRRVRVRRLSAKCAKEA